jgi:ADP-ribose pyrophosphatase
MNLECAPTIPGGERKNMPKKNKAAKAAAPEEAKAVKPKADKAAKTKAKAKKPKAKKSTKPKTTKAKKPKAAKPKAKKSKAAKPKTKKAPKLLEPAVEETEQIISSETLFEGPLFSVVHDKLIEPGGLPSERDIIHHHGSVVILAIDSTKNKRDPWIVIEHQYRHAAGQFLWELPAGKLEAGEDALAGAQRELAEETGYSAKKWKPLVEYYASPGFLGESMKVFLAEDLVAGEAHPEDDEQIDFRLVKLSDAIKMIEKGAILDGKTLTAVLLYARKIAGKHK